MERPRNSSALDESNIGKRHCSENIKRKATDALLSLYPMRQKPRDRRVSDYHLGPSLLSFYEAFGRGQHAVWERLYARRVATDLAAQRLDTLTGDYRGHGQSRERIGPPPSPQR